MLRAKRISHAIFETPDLERQIDYQVNILGLSVAARESDRAVLKTALGQPAVVLKRGAIPRASESRSRSIPPSIPRRLKKR